MSFEEKLHTKSKEIDAILMYYLPAIEGDQKKVIEAMHYSVMAGGKRLRPILMKEMYLLFGGQDTKIEPLMAAIEMIHTYSLIHDDLPAMDDDEYRRGKKTTHIVFGEAIAILAGDALLNYAVEIAVLSGNLRAITTLMRKSGVFGMIGGQTADIIAESHETELNKESLLFIHKNKTAALIEASMMIGAIMAGASEEDIEKTEKIAEKIGIAFQIQDDILDVEGNTETLGKPSGSDEKNHKQTYVTLAGMIQSKEDVRILTKEALTLFEELPGENLFLEQLLKKLVNRSY